MNTLDAVLQADTSGIDDVVRELLLTSRALVGVAARSLADVDEVTLPQFRALVILSTRDGTTVSDLATRLDVHPTTASRLVHRLVVKRLVRRSELAQDRRVTRLHLTAGGRRLVNRVTQRRSRDLARIVERMPPDRWPSVISALAAFAAAADEADDVDLFGWTVSPR
jgi:DNA-binding MarR family transcriptional regulator